MHACTHISEQRNWRKGMWKEKGFQGRFKWTDSRMMNRNRELVPGSWILLIIILEVCKRPTYQNILTAQGAYKSRNSDSMLQHKIKFNKIHIHFIAHTHTHTHTTSHTHTHTHTHTKSHTHTHMHTNRHACSMHASTKAHQQKMERCGGGGTIGSGNKRNLGMWSMGWEE